MDLGRLRSRHRCLAKDSTTTVPLSTHFLKPTSPDFQLYPAFQSIANQITKEDQNSVC